jgi:hypothetical protein
MAIPPATELVRDDAGHHQRPAVEDEVHADERADRPGARHRPVDEDRDSEEHRHDVGDDGMAPTRKPNEPRRTILAIPPTMKNAAIARASTSALASGVPAITSPTTIDSTPASRRRMKPRQLRDAARMTHWMMPAPAGTRTAGGST